MKFQLLCMACFRFQIRFYIKMSVVLMLLYKFSISHKIISNSASYTSHSGTKVLWLYQPLNSLLCVLYEKACYKREEQNKKDFKSCHGRKTKLIGKERQVEQAEKQ